MIYILLFAALVAYLFFPIKLPKSRKRVSSPKNALELLGEKGELKIVNELTSIKSYKRIIRNVYLRKHNFRITEVDVIMVCNRGIFVIESKNYGGTIIGDSNKRFWVQKLKNGQTRKFYSPILQNSMHLQTVARVLGIDYACLKSYVVFSNRSNLSHVNEGGLTRILKLSQLKAQIAKDMRSTPVILTNAQVDNIANFLEITTKNKVAGWVINEHKRQVNDIRLANESTIRASHAPKKRNYK